MEDVPRPRRVIEVNQHIIGPPPPRAKTVRARKVSDYPGVPKAYLDAARRLSSPLLMGPPICDELIELVRHLFTEEEADVVRRLGAVVARSAAAVARVVHRRVEDVEPILERLATEKRVIVGSGPAGKRRYQLMPLVPGIFEMTLIGQSPERLSDWHRRFIELFEAIYETGYLLDYQQPYSTPLVRFLPLGGVVGAHPLALPSDRLEVILDRFQVFGVGNCQCRMSAASLGHGCGKPVGNCTAMGRWAEVGIKDGWLRQVSRQEVLDIKRAAEAEGLVNWILNIESAKGQASCSCCGCCCKAMRAVNEFSAPSLFAPPHFLPRFDSARCTWCGKCARRCPMGALVVDTQGKSRRHLLERCVGCGLCVVACGDNRAVVMEPVPDYRLPYRSWFSFLTRSAPAMLRTSWKVWRSR